MIKLNISKGIFRQGNITCFFMKAPENEVTDRYIFFCTLTEMLWTRGGYKMPAFGYDAFVGLLSLWTRIIDANSFAMEVSVHRRRRVLASGTAITVHNI